MEMFFNESVTVFKLVKNLQKYSHKISLTRSNTSLHALFQNDNILFLTLLIIISIRITFLCFCQFLYVIAYIDLKIYMKRIKNCQGNFNRKDNSIS